MTLTPAMKQYYDMKKEYSDSILFFRMWDFYEMFDEDAHIAHRVLGINITSRNKNASEPTPLAWIPFHAKEKYLPILVNAWYKVAIVEQVSDPNLKWIVKREVVRVVTPSTLSLEWDGYDVNSKSSNLIVSFVEENGKYWISYIDIDENKWYTSEFDSFDDLKSEIYKLSPKEVILEKKLFSNQELKDLLSKKYSLNIYYFDSMVDPRECMLSHFWVKNLQWFWLENKKYSVKASSLLLDYLRSNQKSDFKFLDSISYISFGNYLELDESTIRNLDLIFNFQTKSSTLWTLFWVLNKTKTSAWTRKLRNEILRPLINIEDIKKRQDFIEEFLNSPILLDQVQNELKMVSDIDAILNRLALNRALPKDILNLKRSLTSLVNVFELIEKSWSDKLKSIIN